MSSNSPLPNRHGSAVIDLPSDTEYTITRKFDAPADAVFEAFVTPELVQQWWGFATSEWVVCDIDAQPGGKWRYVVRDGDEEVAFFGEYREVARPDRLVFTEMYEGVPDPGPEHHPVITVTFDEADGVTTMTLLSSHTSKEQRDAVIESGMESGMQISFNRLEDLVRKAG
jgi:uncharacterized protein YndB with AHSA1/START domain